MLRYRYEGPRSEAVVVRNRTKAEFTIGIPMRDVTGEIVKAASGETVIQDLVLSSVLDEGVDGSEVQPEALVEKKEWERQLKRPSIRSLITNKTIEVFAAL
jgi:hypothetical protein